MIIPTSLRNGFPEIGLRGLITEGRVRRDLTLGDDSES
jgi:hypothetical protein